MQIRWIIRFYLMLGLHLNPRCFVELLSFGFRGLGLARINKANPTCPRHALSSLTAAFYREEKTRKFSKPPRAPNPDTRDRRPLVFAQHANPAASLFTCFHMSMKHRVPELQHSIIIVLRIKDACAQALFNPVHFHAHSLASRHIMCPINSGLQYPNHCSKSR